MTCFVGIGITFHSRDDGDHGLRERQKVDHFALLITLRSKYSQP
jgi:hypothetical protein